MCAPAGAQTRWRRRRPRTRHRPAGLPRRPEPLRSPLMPQAPRPAARCAAVHLSGLTQHIFPSCCSGPWPAGTHGHAGGCPAGWRRGWQRVASCDSQPAHFGTVTAAGCNHWLGGVRFVHIWELNKGVTAQGGQPIWQATDAHRGPVTGGCVRLAGQGSGKGPISHAC